jgi:hypothetical protein
MIWDHHRQETTPDNHLAGSFTGVYSGAPCVLAKPYGFTGEELDFIPSTGLRAGINYGVTYRLGQDTGTEDDS